jgi:general secretion pathway protein I
MKRRQAQRGFTLLEVLIAAVLVGSVFVAVVSVMSQSLRNIDRMRPHEQAILHAREKMNEELLRAELQPETLTGEWSDGYRWRVDIVPLDFIAIGKTTAAPQPVRPENSSSVGPLGAGTNTLFQVKVEVAWGGSGSARNYEVQTMQWAKWMAPKS